MLNQEILGRQEQLLRAYCTWLYTTTVRHTGKDRFETPDSIMKRFKLTNLPFLCTTIHVDGNEEPSEWQVTFNLPEQKFRYYCNRELVHENHWSSTDLLVSMLRSDDARYDQWLFPDSSRWKRDIFAFLDQFIYDCNPYHDVIYDAEVYQDSQSVDNWYHEKEKIKQKLIDRSGHFYFYPASDGKLYLFSDKEVMHNRRDVLKDIRDDYFCYSQETPIFYEFIVKEGSWEPFGQIKERTFDDFVQFYVENHQKQAKIFRTIDSVTKTIHTPRGDFRFVNLKKQDLISVGYGYHHSHGKYEVYSNGTDAIAIKKE